MAAPPSSAGEIVLPRPQWGPYSWSWDRYFDDVLEQVLTRPEVVTPPDDVQLTLDLREVLTAKRDAIRADQKLQIELIDNLTAGLHDALVEMVASHPKQLALLSDYVSVASTLREMMPSFRDGPFDAGLQDFCEAITQWLSKPGSPRPDLPASSRLGFLPRPGVVDRARELIAKLYDQQMSVLKQVQPAAREKRHFRALETSHEVQKRELEASVESALLALVNTEFNKAREAATSPFMQVSSFDSLWQTLTTEKTVITPTYSHVDDLVRVREGSIGIAGPRGAGKSTLINYFTSRQGLPGRQRETDRARLGVLVSAPVDYDAREFVLHLYAQVCEAVIKAAGGSVERHGGPTVRHRVPPNNFAWWGAVAAAAGTGGAGLLAVALIRRLTAVSRTPWADVGAGLLVVGVLAISVSLMFAGRSPLTRSSVLTTSVPAMVTTAGLVLFLSNGAWQSSWSLVLGGAALLGLGVMLLLDVARRIRITSALRQNPPVQDSVVEAALERRDEIRTQQSNTVEQSVTFKLNAAPLPVGLDAGGKHGVTRQDRPQGHPELVASLREFLTIAQEKHKMVIAIDELDKLAKPEKVEDFLNDVKAVFGVTGCLFLVSVSEDAAAGFERKGVPFRDVFDSAFDDVISLPHMNLSAARSILYGLLNGWTQPFIALCYVTSGGLARDLMRCARDLVGHRDEDDRIELGEAALLLYRREALARLRAVRHELLRVPDTSRSTDLLKMISGRTEADVTPGRLRTHHTELVEWAQNIQEEAGRPAARLALELGAFMLFASTVLEFFSPKDIARRLREAEQEPAKSLALLAQARQTLATCPQMALDDVAAFRSAWKFD
ncbi:hypothetical protein ABZ345_05600 [Lentzea sp. NPDC005914]|uniref:hypothetical protein n=1 Tax=Lentzea sp. NPDC005914 TaxID=3154572 RepID=UPI0033F1C3EB